MEDIVSNNKFLKEMQSSLNQNLTGLLLYAQLLRVLPLNSFKRAAGKIDDTTGWPSDYPNQALTDS